MQKSHAPLFLFFVLFVSSSINAQDYTLTINFGSGSGAYFYGDTIHVFSDRASGNQVFFGWTGNGVDYLALKEEWHTTLVVSEQSGVEDLELNALYQELPAGVTQTTEQIALFGMDDGVFMENVMKEVHFSIPENPLGIVFLFHGTGGSGSSMYSKYESFTLIKNLYNAGYGSIATDANERTIGDQNGDAKIRWEAAAASQQTFENNIDLYNIRALKDSMVERFELPSYLPFYAYGVSNGANFGDLSAAVLGFQASAHNTANGNSSLYLERPDARPVIWLQAVNDQNASADSTVALANHQALLDRNICSEWHWLKRSPLYEKRFMRSRNGISQQQSTAIYNRIFDFPDLVNADGYFKVDKIVSELPNDFFTPLGLTNNQITDAKAQMKAANADHGATGDFNKSIIRFFESVCLLTSIIDAEENSLRISLFPNPTSDFVYIETENTPLTSAIVFNLQGQVVSEQHFEINNSESNLSRDVQKYKFNLTGLPSGIYFINVKWAGGEEVKRMVLK